MMDHFIRDFCSGWTSFYRDESFDGSFHPRFIRQLADVCIGMKEVIISFVINALDGHIIFRMK